MKRVFPMVFVQWEDPSFSKGPYTLKQEKTRGPILVHDVGFLVHETEGEYHVAASVYPPMDPGPDGDEDETQVLNVTIILKKLVTKFTYLMEEVQCCSTRW